MTDDLGLFDEPEDFRSLNNYRMSEYKFKTCRKCIYKVKVSYGGNIYFKCNLYGIDITEKTNISLDMICDKWKGDGYI